MDCLFCKIVNKEIGSEIVYEDDDVLAFYDIHPVAPIHVLVIPKKHISSMNDITEKNIDDIAKVQLAIPKIAKILKIDEAGYRVICNTGNDGGQVIDHIHYHLIGGKHLGSKIVNE